MSDSPWVHPRFDRPPVVETAFSIEFTPLERWLVPHFGLYWENDPDTLSQLNVHGAIPSQIEH